MALTRLATRLSLTQFSFHIPSTRLYSSQSTSQDASSEPQSQASQPVNIEEILSKPSWSVKSLLPPSDELPADFSITPQKLRRLLRLSALPEPKDAAEETRMLKDLASQLHFVKQVQQVDVEGVEPLVAIRDETKRAETEAEITIEKLAEAFAKEETVGKHFPRIRRRKDLDVKDEDRPKNWNPLDHASRTVGNYFVVDRSKPVEPKE